jgi:hypothetical protein
MNNLGFQDQLLEELEQEFTWRIVEFKQFENVLHEKEADSDFCDTYRKALIIMLYSYYEGYCKSALAMYAEYINKLSLSVKDVTDGLACTSLGSEFNKLLDSNYKPIDFGDRSIKEDSILQSFGRRKEFTSRYVPYLSTKIIIPDDVVDTGSNLWSYVLKKILFRLDMDFELVDDYQKEINELVNKRNSFAHGERKRAPDNNEYTDFKGKALDLMKKIKNITYEHYCNKKYLRI